MKKLLWLSLIVALILGVWLLFRPHGAAPRSKAPAPQTDAPASNEMPFSTGPSSSKSPKEEWVRPAGLDEERWRRALGLRQFLLSQNKPVALYARVLDQNDSPVPDATLKMTLTRVDEQKLATPRFLQMEMGSELTNEVIVLSSDSKGCFTFTGRSGKLITADALEKEGYLWQPGRYIYFDYEHPNGPQGFKEHSQGYVFHLWKKGVAEPLIHIDHRIGVDPFGTNWYAVNLLRGAATDIRNADFRFWFTTLTNVPGQPMRRFRFEAINGGIALDTNAYPFLAPANGYTPSWEWTYEPYGRDRAKSADEALKHRLYISAREGRIYAAITWHWAMENSVHIFGYVNPNGSRNLEPDLAKQITDPEEIRRLDELTAKRANP